MLTAAMDHQLMPGDVFHILLLGRITEHLHAVPAAGINAMPCQGRAGIG